MKLVIIPSDNMVIIDGIGINTLDLSSIKGNVHAIQWDGNIGHTEYNNGQANGKLKAIGSFQDIINAHAAAKYAIENPVYTREQIKDFKLDEIDKKVSRVRSGTLYLHTDGHKYCSNEDLITKILVTIPFVPPDWSIVFKTADKKANGVDNVEVTMDVTAFVQFALGFQERQGSYWYEGERLKKAVKKKYLDSAVADGQVKAFDVETEWKL